MEKKSDPNIWKYLVFAGALGLSYLMVNYLSKAKKSKLKPLSIEKTKQALRQIKYQMLTTCNSYSEAVNRKTGGKAIEEDLEIVFRTEVAKLYEGREQVVLEKLEVGKDEYAASLQAHKKNPRIEQDINEIIAMMESTIRGRSPDMSVPSQASERMGNADLCQVYLEMCEMISIRMWEKLDQCRRDNPSFNSRDELHYKKAMKELSIYSLKWDFLVSKGFQQSWGSPNEVFYKILEVQKARSEAVKAKCIKIEKAFDKAIEKVTTETENLNRERIKFILAENMQDAAEAPRAPAQARPFNGGVAVSKSVGAPAKKKEEDGQFDMDNLMMQELMNRSAEERQEEEVVQVQERKRIVRGQTLIKESPLKGQDESAAAPVGGVLIVQPAEGEGQIQSPKRKLYSKQTIEGWIPDEEDVGGSQLGGVFVVNPNDDRTQIIDPPPRKISEEQWEDQEQNQQSHEYIPLSEKHVEHVEEAEQAEQAENVEKVEPVEKVEQAESHVQPPLKNEQPVADSDKPEGTEEAVEQPSEERASE